MFQRPFWKTLTEDNYKNIGARKGGGPLLQVNMSNFANGCTPALIQLETWNFEHKLRMQYTTYKKTSILYSYARARASVRVVHRTSIFPVFRA